jgi:hypothetical protein
MRRQSGRKINARQRRAQWLRLVVRRRQTGLIVLVVVVLAAAGVVLIERTPDAAGSCGRLFVPAYFYAPADWQQADRSGPPLGFMILDISGIGAGSAPDPHFQGLVSRARSAGITVLGYSSTEDGQRQAAAVETDVRHYKDWYGVTDMFLDRVSGFQQDLGYYRQLASYIHGYDHGSEVWMNVGAYPEDRQYTAVANVMVVFEGTYSQYRQVQVPSWAGSYSPAKFAATIYATPQDDLASALSLAVKRRAEHVYVTDGSGPDPYSSLPSYWKDELSAVSAECSDPGGTAQ